MTIWAKLVVILSAGALAGVILGALAYAVWRWLRPASNDTPWVRRPFDEGGEE